MVIKKILSSSNYNPFAKLLTIRFIRETIFLSSYSFMTLFNSEIATLLYDIGCYKKSSNDEERAKDMFIEYKGD